MYMRRLTMFPACLALLLALFMAPYQHVHLAADRQDDAGGGHHDDHHKDDAALVHVHLYAESIPASRNGQSSIDDPYRDHVSRSLDTFATMPPLDIPVLYRPQSRVLVFPPEEWVVAVVEGIEPCGHDPPLIASFAPRAPPV